MVYSWISVFICCASLLYQTAALHVQQTPPYNVSKQLEKLDKLLRQDVQYSVGVYGAAGRLPPMSELRMFWMQALDETSRKQVEDLRAPELKREPWDEPNKLFQSQLGIDPPGAVWIHKIINHTRFAIPKNSYVEVTHCARGSSTKLDISEDGGILIKRSVPQGKVMDWCDSDQIHNAVQGRFCSYLWLFRAEGSGISVNVGNTTVCSPPSHGVRFVNASCVKEKFDQGYDSVQMQHVAEAAPEDIRQEIVFRWDFGSETTHLSPSTPTLRCGRDPNFFACTKDNPGLMAMSSCR